MHWESFYVRPKDISDDELVFTGDEARHLSRSMRKKKGNVVWAVDGVGGAYEAELIHFTKERVTGHILQRRRRLGEPVAGVTLAQSVIKGERFDWLIEKAVELGVSRLIPVITEKTVAGAGAQKLARWRRVAMAAMKQCGRSVLPEIAEPRTFKQVVSMGADCRHRLIAFGGPGSVPLRIPEGDAPSRALKAFLIVGPEGGFTEEEIALAHDQNFQPIKLGPRRLRSETAGMVILTQFMSQLGEMQ